MNQAKEWHVTSPPAKARGLHVLSLRTCYCITLATKGSVPAHFLDVVCGILVPMQHQTTVRTGVGPHREGFGNIGIALRTILACIARTDFEDGFDGAFSLGLQNTEELSPTNIRDGS